MEAVMSNLESFVQLLNTKAAGSERGRLHVRNWALVWYYAGVQKPSKPLIVKPRIRKAWFLDEVPTNNGNLILESANRYGIILQALEMSGKTSLTVLERLSGIFVRVTAQNTYHACIPSSLSLHTITIHYFALH